MAANPLPTPPQSFAMQLEISDGLAILHCHGNLTGDCSERFSSELRDLCRQYKRIELDFSGLRRMDSSGLGALVSSFFAAKNTGCDLKLTNPSDRIKSLLNTTHLSSVFFGPR